MVPTYPEIKHDLFLWHRWVTCSIISVIAYIYS
jgi:hypothetical protein